MYSKLPHVVYGFHGCDETVKNKILHKNSFFSPSHNAYDWLGHGIYFWENDPLRAMEFAEEATTNTKQSKGAIKTSAVIGAVIDLGYCLNFLHVLNEAMDHNKFDSVRCLFQEGEPLYENSGFYKQTHIQLRNEEGKNFFRHDISP